MSGNPMYGIPSGSKTGNQPASTAFGTEKKLTPKPRPKPKPKPKGK